MQSSIAKVLVCISIVSNGTYFTNEIRCMGRNSHIKYQQIFASSRANVGLKVLMRPNAWGVYWLHLGSGFSVESSVESSVCFHSPIIYPEFRNMPLVIESLECRYSVRRSRLLVHSTQSYQNVISKSRALSVPDNCREFPGLPRDEPSPPSVSLGGIESYEVGQSTVHLTSSILQATWSQHPPPPNCSPIRWGTFRGPVLMLNWGRPIVF